MGILSRPAVASPQSPFRWLRDRLQLALLSRTSMRRRADFTLISSVSKTLFGIVASRCCKHRALEGSPFSFEKQTFLKHNWHTAVRFLVYCGDCAAKSAGLRFQS